MLTGNETIDVVRIIGNVLIHKQVEQRDGKLYVRMKKRKIAKIA